MKITATQDDGTEIDVTELVTHSYEVCWEALRWGRDIDAADSEKLAALARVIGHPSADMATETAGQARADENAQEAAELEWYRQRQPNIWA